MYILMHNTDGCHSFYVCFTLPLSQICTCFPGYKKTDIQYFVFKYVPKSAVIKSFGTIKKRLKPLAFFID